MSTTKRVSVLILVVLIAGNLGWTILIGQSTEAFLSLFFGFAVMIFGVFQLIRELIFLQSPKDLVIGEMVRLNEETCGDGSTYRPIYRYRYENEEREYKSNLASFTYRKMPVGTKVELMVVKKNPNIVRLNEPLLFLIPTLITLALIVIGTLFCMNGINLFD